MDLLYLAWLDTIVATLMSLYFSEIIHFTPCTLCWYQRILMYPLVAIIAVGIKRKDKCLPFYVLPLSSLGIVIAFYHFLLQEGVIKEALTPCSNGVSCTVKYFNYFGFINIPFLSFLAFLLINVCMVLYLRGNNKRKDTPL